MQDGAHAFNKVAVEQLRYTIMLWCVMSGEALLGPLFPKELCKFATGVFATMV